MAEIRQGRPVVVHCAGGYRSSVAACLLPKEPTDASDLLGGYTAWAAAVAQPAG
jgi:rhodanese-related sulfurtransferase